MNINIYVNEPQISDCETAFVLGTTIIGCTYPLKIYEKPSFICYSHMIMSGTASLVGSYAFVQTKAGKYVATGVCMALAGYTGYKFISNTFFSNEKLN